MPFIILMSYVFDTYLYKKFDIFSIFWKFLKYYDLYKNKLILLILQHCFVLLAHYYSMFSKKRKGNPMILFIDCNVLWEIQEIILRKPRGNCCNKSIMKAAHLCNTLQHTLLQFHSKLRTKYLVFLEIEIMSCLVWNKF